MKINERLKQIRKENKLTQQEEAEKIGVTEMQVWRWEKGTSGMEITKLKALCELYEVSADWILGLSEKKNRD